MEEKNYSYEREHVKKWNYHLDDSILVIDGYDCFPQKMDYSNSQDTMILASNAVNTADGIRSLIKKALNSNSEHMEILLSFSALSCEIYMKAIIYHEHLNKGKVIKMHNLDNLFKLLPEKNREELSNSFPSIAAILPNIGDTFELLRYNFEQNRVSGQYLFVFDLMDRLHEIVQQYPMNKVGVFRVANGTLSIE